ncbi:thiolase family protein [Gordonia terrae]|uniref:Acetyl-CoA C-acyltransferase n=2 Tax=Gordonia terrae TaxID=2055 RepID=A0AAD0KFV8_9ACTN|nr:thiolase family protein [Gordonia terrae]VTR08068.1 acetyl-CoA acetyltransferase [Clostridioides difficile]ANY25200.1 fatty acid oxidation complex subunit beta [Gordonia terrae]AWO85947.1 acetyl-CoA C-acyltransferase [Gordonia terrae]VTS62152.1 Putative acyltransferase Rv0859 [Gordonia terrae]GAB45539.1 putative fatty acid oxidation complex subunit beta [Gordonia terrae NBRC 100016]
MAQFSSGVYVYDAVRSPKARVRKQGGTFADVPAHDLLGQLLIGVRERGLPVDTVGDILIGTSTAVGEQGGNIARAAALWAGWPDTVNAGVVSRLCCSGLDAIETGAAKVASGIADVVVTGGVESMSRVPMMADKPAMAFDDTLGERTGFVTIGVSADLTAARYGFSRADLDQAAVTSHERAAAAPTSDSVVPIKTGEGSFLGADEGPRPGLDLAALAELKPIFGDDPSWKRVANRLPGVARPEVGLHTAATAPALADGAALAVLGSRSAEQALGRKPIAEIVGVAQAAVRSPLLTAPVDAARRALASAGITAAHLDTVEANESFAASVLLIRDQLGIEPAKVNPVGGSMATGHPLGAGGGVLLVNALDHLRRVDGEYALVTIPAALGLGAALVIRRMA